MSFRLRLFVWFSLLIALTFGVGGTFLISTSFQSMLEEEKASAIAYYETTHNNLQMLKFFAEDGDYDNMTAMLLQMDEQKTARWQAISLYVGNDCVYQSGDRTLLPVDLPAAEENQYAYTVVTDDRGRRLQLYSCLEREKEEIYLKASFDLSAAYKLRENQQKLFWIIYCVVMMLGILLAGLLAYVLTKRLRSLTNVVQEIAGGKLSRRSQIHTKDEFGQLSKDLDLMADRLEENILQLEEDVRKKEEFMGAVAHELKTPMTSIIGYADLIRQCALNESDQIAAANYIFTEGKRLEKLAFRLLDLLMMDKDITSMREVDLEGFLSSVVQGLLPRAKEQQVFLYWKADAGTVFIEPDLVKSLLYNLVDNAIKSMQTEETKSVNSVSNEKMPFSLEEIHAKKSKKDCLEKRIMIKGDIIPEGVEFQVADNGCGMEKEELSRITEAFYRVDKSRSREQGGAGLGLTLCKKIVELHNGTMEFRSVKGAGSWVIVKLYGTTNGLGDDTKGNNSKVTKYENV